MEPNRKKNKPTDYSSTVIERKRVSDEMFLG